MPHPEMSYDVMREDEMRKDLGISHTAHQMNFPTKCGKHIPFHKEKSMEVSVSINKMTIIIMFHEELLT